MTLIGVTVWSCFDGRRPGAMIFVAAVGTYALLQVLALSFHLLRPARLANALFSGVAVMLFMPAWDWLSRQWLYPESIWGALGFGTFFGLMRWFFSPRGPAHPPS